MEDSQDYWLHDDMGTLFENWNGVEGDVMGGGEFKNGSGYFGGLGDGRFG